MLSRIAKICLDHPALAWSGIAAATALSLCGALRLETAVGYRALLGAEHPAVERLDTMTARFGGGLAMAVVWGCEDAAPCENALDPVSLAMAHRVASAMVLLPGVLRVDSPATSPLWFAPALGIPERRTLVDPATGNVDRIELDSFGRLEDR